LIRKEQLTMAPNRKLTAAFLAITLVSLFLRLALVMVNREANDDHMAVVNYILKSNSLPQKADCDECFQPKFYYFTVAKTLQVLGQANLGPNKKILFAELINFLVGLATLLVVWIFLDGLPGRNGGIKTISFALVALNPGLIGINSQATNDSFAILFSTLALYCTYRFLQKRNGKAFILIVLFTLMGVASKTNVWVTAIAILLVFLVQIWMQKEERIEILGYAIAFLIAIPLLSIINPLNQYLTNYRNYGSPIVINMDQRPSPPLFFKVTPVARPGILSIQDGYFTFKFFDLLEHPRIENTDDNYPPLRTSLWTLLYGRANSVHFDNWPPSWSSTGETNFEISRGIFILALLPTSLLLIGAIVELVRLCACVIKRNYGQASQISSGLLVISFWGYIMFIILYTFLYRNFSFMKAIFIYPALLVFPMLFFCAVEFLSDRLSKGKRWINSLLEIWVGALSILYVIDIVTLVLQIYSRRQG
jgi:hypothetical protein